MVPLYLIWAQDGILFFYLSLFKSGDVIFPALFVPLSGLFIKNFFSGIFAMGNCALLPTVGVVCNDKKAIQGVFTTLEFDKKRRDPLFCSLYFFNIDGCQQLALSYLG